MVVLGLFHHLLVMIITVSLVYVSSNNAQSVLYANDPLWDGKNWKIV